MARPRRMTNMGSRPPVTERGVADPFLSTSSTFNVLSGRPAPWSTFVDRNEYVPELQWPESIRTYDEMRTDSQLAGLLTALIYGISQLRFMINPNSARPEIVKDISEDLNLPIQGEEDQPLGRMKGRFSHSQHVSQALLSMIWGHMYFEMVGEIVDGKWRLRKLAPRMPHTISEIAVADDGGLVYIKQQFGFPQAVPLEVDRLVAFIFQKEGPNWVGRSILRDCYKNWLIKDRLVRVDAVNHERAGGVPYAVGPPEAGSTELQELGEIMQQFKVGDSSGGALPYGSELRIAKGTGSDVVGSINMHDEAMARRFLLMVANLAQSGQHVGSYALGEVFQDFFFLGQRAIAQWYCDIMNEHVIEDWVDWNYGEDEELTPRLTWEGEDEVLGPDQLSTLVDKGVITMDDETENWFRYKKKVPIKKEPRPQPEPVKVDDGAGGDGGPAPSSKPPARSPAAKAAFGTLTEKMLSDAKDEGIELWPAGVDR